MLCLPPPSFASASPDAPARVTPLEKMRDLEVSTWRWGRVFEGELHGFDDRATDQLPVPQRT